MVCSAVSDINMVKRKLCCRCVYTHCYIDACDFFSGHGYHSKRNASQVLPWQDRTCLQRNPTCCWHHCQQAGQVSRKWHLSSDIFKCVNFGLAHTQNLKLLQSTLYSYRTKTMIKTIKQFVTSAHLLTITQ